MATGYIFTKTGNSSTKVVHVTNDVVDLGRTKIFKGPVLIEENDASLISIKEGGGNAMSLNIGAIVTIDGSAPAGTMEGVIDQLDAVFPDASTSGGSGGGLDAAGVRSTAITGFTTPNDYDPNNSAKQVTATDTILSALRKIWAAIMWLVRWVLGQKALVWNVEDYGAVPIDPSNPTAAADSTAAIQACIMDAYANDPSDSPIIYLPGRYKIATNPSRMINGNQHYCQLYIPYTAYNATRYKKLTFKGKSTGAVDGAVAPATSMYGGSGFYSTWIEGSQRTSCVLGFEYSPLTGTFERFNYTEVELVDISVITETYNGTAHIANFMSGVDFDYLTCANVVNFRARTTSAYVDMVEPGQDSFGLRMPRINNHAILNIYGTCYASGYWRGIVGGEHCTAAQITAVYCAYGFTPRSKYAQHIGQMCLEGNIVNIEGSDDVAVSIGVYQAENYNTGAWAINQYDFYTAGTPSKFHLSIGQTQAHGYGGATLQLSLSSPDIDLKIISDEGGLYRVPLNVWDTASRPVALRNYFFGLNTDLNNIEYYVNGTWTELGGAPVAYLLHDDFNRSNSSSSLGNTVIPGTGYTVTSGVWGINSNKAYCVSESSTGATTFYYVTKDVAQADGTWQVDITRQAGGVGALLFRWIDSTHHMFLQLTGSNLTLYKINGGSYTQIGIFTFGFTDGGTNTFQVVTSGDSIIVSVDGAPYISVTESANNTGTAIGMCVVGGTGFGGGIKFDNLIFY